MYYDLYDEQHKKEQQIITEEERNAKSPPRRTIQSVMKNVCVYVEVRTGEDNRSAGIKRVLTKRGAKVNERLYRDTTHVIFKDGLQSTYNKAKRMNIPIVSILWMDDVKKQMRLVETEKYEISNKERYENPELYKKIRVIIIQ